MPEGTARWRRASLLAETARLISGIECVSGGYWQISSKNRIFEYLGKQKGTANSFHIDKTLACWETT